MFNIYKILVAADLSKYARPLVRYGCQLARDLDAELLVAAVIDQRVVDALKHIIKKHSGPTPDVYLQDKEHAYAEQLQDLVGSSAGSQVAYRIAVRTGVPFKAILSIIDEESPDLLIMGTKGRTNLADVIIGSCAEKLFRRSPIPVLTLPADFTSI
jgi:nucleotide-binding universal stress UspA family protein